MSPPWYEATAATVTPAAEAATVDAAAEAVKGGRIRSGDACHAAQQVNTSVVVMELRLSVPSGHLPWEQLGAGSTKGIPPRLHCSNAARHVESNVLCGCMREPPLEPSSLLARWHGTCLWLWSWIQVANTTPVQECMPRTERHKLNVQTQGRPHLCEHMLLTWRA
jgi:hypothetical protein